MNTKRKLSSMLMLSFLMYITACSNEKKDEEAVIYTCPMHPQIQRPNPGQCPICNMDLVPMTHKESKVSNDISIQIISPSKQVLSRQKAIKLNSNSELKSLNLEGYIDYDKSRNKSVSARIGGRIEKLFVKYNLQFVKKGAKILELYSPELNTFQEEHLFLLKTEKEEHLKDQSRERLKLLGLSNFQITQLERNGTFTQTIAVYSPTNGYISFNDNSMTSSISVNNQQESMNNMGMKNQGSSNNTFTAKSNQIREGSYINKGETLFSINDLKTVWVIVSVPGDVYSQIRKDKPVSVVSELYSDKKYGGKVGLLEQNFEEEDQRFIRIRIVLPNADKALKINSLAKIKIPLESDLNFQVPASSVYRTGLNSYVWVKTGETENGSGIFRLRKVITGKFFNGKTTIISGLDQNEEIAEHAGYLADSETFLNEN